MLHTPVSAGDKRRAFRQQLNGDATLQFPGAFTPLSAKLIERHGFDGVYVSGAVMSAELGLPDIGLTTLSEVAQRAGQISRVTALPTIVDADTGFGEPMNVARTVHVLEDAGVTAIHIEDQVNPKRCGHLDGKSIVDVETATKRIKAAVDARRDPDFVIIARTDARAIDGLHGSIDRAKALVDAGAEVIFAEAMESLAEFEHMVSAVTVPVLANMTEFGKSELFSLQALRDVGVRMVIYPVSLLRLAMGAAERGLETLRRDGHLGAAVESMQTRAELYDLVDYESYAQFDGDVYSFGETFASDTDS